MALAERQALSREVIAEAALRVTDESGLSGLSMRKLGAELGVEAMSLYHYVKNKDDLLDAVLSRLYSEIQLPEGIPAQEWERAIRHGAVALYEVLTQHPAALELFSSRPARSLSAINVLVWPYRRFRMVGLSSNQALQALRFGVAFVLGHAGTEAGILTEVHDRNIIDPTLIPEPELQTFVADIQDMDEREMFRVGLDSMIAGLKVTFGLP